MISLNLSTIKTLEGDSDDKESSHIAFNRTNTSNSSLICNMICKNWSTTTGKTSHIPAKTTTTETQIDER